MKRSRGGIALVLTCTLSMASATVKAEIMTYTDKLGRVVDISVPEKSAAIFQTYEFVPYPLRRPTSYH